MKFLDKPLQSLEIKERIIKLRYKIKGSVESISHFIDIQTYQCLDLDTNRQRHYESTTNLRNTQTCKQKKKNNTRV